MNEGAQEYKKIRALYKKSTLASKEELKAKWRSQFQALIEGLFAADYSPKAGIACLHAVHCNSMPCTHPKANLGIITVQYCAYRPDMIVLLPQATD